MVAERMGDILLTNRLLPDGTARDAALAVEGGATVPEDLPAMTTEVVICTFGASDRKVCSAPALITLSTD